MPLAPTVLLFIKTFCVSKFCFLNANLVFQIKSQIYHLANINNIVSKSYQKLTLAKCLLMLLLVNVYISELLLFTGKKFTVLYCKL